MSDTVKLRSVSGNSEVMFKMILLGIAIEPSSSTVAEQFADIVISRSVDLKCNVLFSTVNNIQFKIGSVDLVGVTFEIFDKIE